jgi:hypothetical protein
MGVRDGDARQPVLAREEGRLLVAPGSDDAGVVDLDPIDIRGDALEVRLAQDGVPEPVERMGDPDETALLADGRDRLGGRQARPDGPIQEQADQVAVGRLHLFADDDRQAGRGEVARPEGSVDPVVVGDREVGEAPRGGRPDDILLGGERVEACSGMAMQIDEGPRAHGPRRVLPPAPTRPGTSVRPLRSAGRATS